MSLNDQSTASFKADLEKFAEQTTLTYNDVIRWVVLSIWTKITDRTPVDTGRARASWNLAVGAPDPKIPPPKLPNTGGIGKPSDPTVTKSDIESGKPIFVTSNLDYIEYLEAGSSDQAAGGMVEISIAEVEVEINNAIKQL